MTGPLPAGGRTNLLLLRVGDEWFAVPIAASAEVVRLAADDAGAEELPYRAGRVPLVDGGVAFGVPSWDARAVAVVVRGGERTFALAVDAAVPEPAADLSAARPVPWPDDGVLLGVLPRGDTVVALVDVDALAALALPRATPPDLVSLPPASAGAGAPESAHRAAP